ncbi:MAG TPA: hypothetical protein VFG83_00440 [Kofleriaceae bacterium]|nr:hypothetical protein [Kofleriaceae bacterium]
MMEIRQQDDQISSKWIIIVLAGVFLVFGVAILWVFLRIPATLGQRAAPPAVDRLEPQVKNGVDWSLFSGRAPGLELKAKQRVHLESYGWTHRARGMIHIPIRRAMELTLVRGSQPSPTGEVRR